MFKKQFFPEATIKSIATNQAVYNQGKDLFQKKLVRDLELNEKNRAVEFTVYDEQKQKTYFSFLKNGLAQKYSCDCRDFQRQSGACRHVIASMMQLNTFDQDAFYAIHETNFEDLDTPSSQLQFIRKNRKILNTLFEEAKKDIQSQTISFSKPFLQFEIVLNMFALQNAFEYELYLKVGEDHLYVVKDIIEVLHHLLNGKPYMFGKQLTYSPETHGILPDERKILTYIYEIAKIQQETINMVYGQHTPNTSGVLSIPPNHVAKLLKSLALIDGGFVRIAPPPKLLSSINQLVSPTIAATDEKIPITFTVSQEKDQYLLDISEADKQKEVRVHPIANIISIDSTFYLLDAATFNKASLLVDTMKNMMDQPLKLTENDLTSFYSLILPTLKEIFEYEIDENIENEIKSIPLVPELYIDYDHKNLLIKPIFKYENTEIFPLEENSSSQNLNEQSQMFIRDVYNEQETLNVLTHYFARNKIKDGHYVLDTLDAISIFIYDSLIELSELMNIYLSKDAQNIIYHSDSSLNISIEMNRTSNLLDIRFDITDVTEEELPQLVRALQKSENRFFKLNSGKIIDLQEEDFQKFSQNIKLMDLKPEEISNDTSVSLFRGLSVIEDDSVNIGADFEAFVKELKEPKHLTFEIPKSLTASLRPYQETGFKWLSTLDYYGLGGVLADDMGLGKTIQAITFILSKIEKMGGKYLIICPSSVVYNWEREFEKFGPTTNTIVISGTIEEREHQLKEALNNDEIDVLISSYPLIQRDIEYYHDYKFQSIILDESQNVKNDATKTTKAVRKLNANTIYALSGTPIENNLNELWSLFSIILPGLFRTKKSFSDLTEQQIAQKIDLFVLRRMKEDVLEDLPPKTETIEFIELSDEQKQLYQTQLSLIRNDVESLIEQDSFEQNRMRVLAGMTRLRQICCDPRLINEDYEGGSSKLERLMEYLNEALTNKKRVVLFSQFTSMLHIIRDILDKNSIDYHYLDGSTPKKDRFELTTRFNNGEKDLFLVSLRAGGTGLNLTGGDTVILYDSWWNPAIEDQAADRVHRFGQKKSVQVIRLIMKGTIEEGINELQEQKRELIDAVIRTNEDKNMASLTKEDILELLIN